MKKVVTKRNIYKVFSNCKSVAGATENAYCCPCTKEGGSLGLTRKKADAEFFICRACRTLYEVNYAEKKVHNRGLRVSAVLTEKGGRRYSGTRNY